MSDPASSMTLATRWRVAGGLAEVSDALEDIEAFPRWWPEVYLEARIMAAGDPDGIGRRFEVLTRGWLPYTLRWQGEIVENRKPHGWTIAAEGDLRGEGVWRLAQDGAAVDAQFLWTVFVEKRALRPLAWMLRPAFAANHRWAMARGLEGLKRELARRRAT